MEIDILKNIKNGPYVELAVSDDPRNYSHWSDSSIFLDETVFGVFAHCFASSNKNFNYYGPTLYSKTELKELQRELLNSLSIFRAVHDHSSLASVITSDAMGRNFLSEVQEEFNLEADWKITLNSLININVELCEMVATCNKDDHFLWVLGI